MPRCLPLSLLVCVMIALPTTHIAHAGLTTRAQEATAVANCQGALPAYEGAIRKRPLAVQNEGGSAAFVTCAFAVTERPKLARLWFNAINGSAVAISCTAVSGATGAAAYASKTVTAPANGSRVDITWLPTDFGTSGAFATRFVSMSCALPAGAGIIDSHVVFDEDVGD